MEKRFTMGAHLLIKAVRKAGLTFPITKAEAIRRAGAQVLLEPVRGGTDGCKLTYMGLPCPNLGTGGFGFHGPYEHASVEGMDLCVDVLLNIVDAYAK